MREGLKSRLVELKRHHVLYVASLVMFFVLLVVDEVCNHQKKSCEEEKRELRAS